MRTTFEKNVLADMAHVMIAIPMAMPNSPTARQAEKNHQPSGSRWLLWRGSQIVHDGASIFTPVGRIVSYQIGNEIEPAIPSDLNDQARSWEREGEAPAEPPAQPELRPPVIAFGRIARAMQSDAASPVP